MSTTKKRISSPQVPEPPPQTWSNCLVVGNQVFVAGMIARDGDKVLGGDSMYEQAKVIFGKIKHLVEAAGGRMDDIVKVQIFVTDIKRREEVWKARREAFTGDFPVSTLVEVRALAAPEILVEVEAIAILGAGRPLTQSHREGASTAPLRALVPPNTNACAGGAGARSGTQDARSKLQCLRSTTSMNLANLRRVVTFAARATFRNLALIASAGTPPKVEGRLLISDATAWMRLACSALAACVPRLRAWHDPCSLVLRYQMNDAERSRMARDRDRSGGVAASQPAAHLGSGRHVGAVRIVQFGDHGLGDGVRAAVHAAVDLVLVSRRLLCHVARRVHPAIAQQFAAAVVSAVRLACRPE